MELKPLQRKADGLCDEDFEGASLAELREAGFTSEECLEAGLSPEERMLQEADDLHATERVVLGISGAMPTAFMTSTMGRGGATGRGGAMPIAAPAHPPIRIAPTRQWARTRRATALAECAGILLVRAIQAALFVWTAGGVLFVAVRLGRALLASISRGDYSLVGGDAGDAGAWSQVVGGALGGAAACSVFMFVVGWALADYHHGRCATWAIGDWAIAAFVILQGLVFLGVGAYLGLLATLRSDALPHIKASGVALWGLLLIAAASRPWRLLGCRDWPCCMGGTLMVRRGAGAVGGGGGGGM